MGKKFWRAHFKCFAFIEALIVGVIDLLEEKMRFPELSIIMTGYFLLGLDAELQGSYEANSLCQSYLPEYIEVPQFFLEKSNVFFRYSRTFYPIFFIGNLEKTPFLLAVVCMGYCCYDFSLVLTDVISK